MWLLRIELKTSRRTVSVLNHWAISPAPILPFYGHKCFALLYVCTMWLPIACRGQKRALGPLELQLQIWLWVAMEPNPGPVQEQEVLQLWWFEQEMCPAPDHGWNTCSVVGGLFGGSCRTFRKWGLAGRSRPLKCGSSVWHPSLLLSWSFSLLRDCRDNVRTLLSLPQGLCASAVMNDCVPPMTSQNNRLPSQTALSTCQTATTQLMLQAMHFSPLAKHRIANAASWLLPPEVLLYGSEKCGFCTMVLKILIAHSNVRPGQSQGS